MIKNLKFIKKLKTLFYILSFLSSITDTLGEYRVYQYWIKSKSRDKAELITTSLNPKAYLAYYGNEKEISLNLMRSWVCHGDTGGQRPPCRFEESISLNPNDGELGETKINEAKQ